MRCALYARVSTMDQSCEMQLRELREYVAHRGWTVAGEYVDTGWSGAKASRPELDRLMADASKRRFDIVLVWKVDRWGRSLSDMVQSLQKLRGLDIAWCAVTQGISTEASNPMATLLLHLLGAFAEFEREMLRERVKAGVLMARRNGKHLGRPKAVFDREELRRLAESGLSLREIGRRLGIGKATVAAYLEDKP